MDKQESIAYVQAKKAMELLNLTATDFVEGIMPVANFYRRKYLTDDEIVKIHKKYGIALEWILFGSGDFSSNNSIMQIAHYNTSSVIQQNNHVADNKTIQLLEARIKDLEARIKDKEDLIALLKK